MPTIEIRARELEVATLRAQSDAAMATALSAVATMVQDSITARAVEHARHVAVELVETSLDLSQVPLLAAEIEFYLAEEDAEFLLKD